MAGPKPGLIAACCAALVATVSASAFAQQKEFGKRDETVISVERIFGFHHLDLGEGSIEGFAYHPYLWGSVGIHGASSSGLTFGALLGLTYINLPARDPDDEDEAVSFLQVRPRIGYAGWLQKGLGYWVRGGPTGYLIIDHDQSETHWSLTVGFEAYAVVRASRHVAFLFGPHFEPQLFADEDGDKGEGDYRIGSYGLTAGMMGELF